MTAMMVAALGGHVAVVEALLKAGANKDVQDKVRPLDAAQPPPALAV